MKQTKLLWKFVVILTIVAMMVVGCSSPAPEPEEPTPAPEEETEAEPTPEEEKEEEPAAEEPVEIVFWGGGSDPWWDEFTEKFNEEHENITVKLEVFESEAYKIKLDSAVLAGTEPCLYFTIPGPVSEQWIEHGEVTLLDEYVDADRVVPSARDGCSSGGDLTCVPLYISPGFMYYNVDMFEEAGVDPQTWADPMQPTVDEFLEAGEAIKEAGHVPLAVGNADNWPGLFYYWASHDRYGGVQTLWDAIDGKESFEHESFVKAAEFVQDLTDRGFFPEGVNGMSGEAKYSVFTQEIGAIIYMGTWMTGRIANDAREDFEWGIFHFPSFPDGDPASRSDIMSGTDGIWLSSQCPNPEAAVEYMNAFIDMETQLWYLEETGNIPAYAGVVDAAKAAGMESPAMMLGEASKDAAHMFPWWDWALSQPMTEEMLAMSQGLLDKSITPEEFGQRLEALR